MAHEILQCFSLLEDKAVKGFNTLLWLGVKEVVLKKTIKEVLRRGYGNGTQSVEPLDGGPGKAGRNIFALERIRC